MPGVFVNRAQSQPLYGGGGHGDVYFNPGIEGLGTVGTIRRGQPTTYQSIPQGFSPNYGGSTVGDGLVDRAIQARQSMDAHRADLADQLNYVNPRSREAASIMAQIHGIDFAHRMAQRNSEMDSRNANVAAQQSYRQADQNRRSAIDSQGAAMMDELGTAARLHANGQITDDQFADHMAGLPAKYPYAMQHGGATSLLRFYAELPDRQQAYQQRLSGRDAAIIGRKYGVQVQTDDQGNPSIQATMDAAMQSPRGKAEQLGVLNQELSRNYGLPTGVASIFNPVEQHKGGVVDAQGNFQPTDENQTHIRIPFLNQKGLTQYATLPMETFNHIKADFQPRYESIVGQLPQAQPVQAPPPTTPAAAPQTQFQVGKTYQDAQGNKAVYNQDGTWTQQ